MNGEKNRKQANPQGSTEEIKDMIKGEKKWRLWLNPSDKHNSHIACDQWPRREASKAAAGASRPG